MGDQQGVEVVFLRLAVMVKEILVLGDVGQVVWLYLLLVYDLSGRVLITKDIAAVEGNNFIELNTDQLAPGMYVARLAGESNNGQVRFLVN